MTMSRQEPDSRRPLWMPHPAVLAFIAVLWAVAAAAQGLSRFSL